MQLVPKPQSYEAGEGSLELQSPRAFAADVELAGHGLRLLERLEVAKPTAVAGEAKIHLLVDPTAAEGHAEGYELAIDSDKAVVRGSDAAGLFYGCQSLAQLIEHGRAPQVRIRDWPKYSWRGMHLDVCRHFFDVEFVKRFLDLLAAHKLNRFHWHLTEDQGWRIQIDRYPRLTEIGAWRDQDGARYGGFYTKEQIIEVVEYAAERMITVVPEVELPGHALAALTAYPEYSCTGGPFAVATTWGIFDDVYCPGNDTTLRFLENVLEEVLPLFPGEFVHVGGDECPKVRWQSCSKCQQRMRDEQLSDEDALQSWTIRHFSKFLHDRGKRLIGWDEILQGGLAPGATVMSWQGVAGGIAAARQGHDVVMCPTSHCYFDYKQDDHEDEPGYHGVTPLQTVYGFEPTPSELTDAEAKHVLGAQGNLWTERMSCTEDVDFMALPRMCALAEVVWYSGPKDYDEFRGRLPHHLLRLRAKSYSHREL